ncbi:MAG: hypothetical protein QGF57_07770 [Candidatus Marinimicrobia bacterium]|nr:hypothetical protein [Candidatus Neomarinimicrobiota bacterium]
MSLDFFIYLISFITLTISTIWMVKLSGKNFILTLPGFFYIHFVIFIFIGSPWFYLYRGGVNHLYILATHLVILILPLGVLLSNKLLRVNFSDDFNHYLSQKMEDKQPGNQFFMFYLFALIIALAVTFLYFSKLDIIPVNFIFQHFTDDVNFTDLAKLRESATTTFTLGKLHRYKFFMAQMIPLLIIVAFFKSKLSSMKLWKIVFLFLTVFAMYRSVADLQKKPLLDFIILLFTAGWIFKGRINWKQVSAMVAVSISILCVMYIFIMGFTNRPFWMILEGVANRLFLGQTSPLYYYFSLFPSAHDFLYGASLPNPGGIFQFDNFTLTKWIFINGLNRSWEIVGTAPSAFIGEMYANFGFPIMIVSILFLSMSLQIIQIKFIQKPRTLLMSAFYTYFVFLSGQFAMTGMFIVAHVYLVIFLLLAIFFVDGYKLYSGNLKHV